MKICILSAFEDSMLKDTGASVRIYNLSKGLASLGYDVELVLPKNQESYEYIDGVKVHELSGFIPKKLMEAIGRLMGVDRATTLFFYDLFFIHKVSKIISKSNIVQFEQQSAGALLVPIAAKILKKPVVIDCHDIFQALRVKNTNVQRRIFETFFEKMVYKLADLILAVSGKEKHFLLSRGIGKDKIEVIPNGVDTRAFQGSKADSGVRKKYGLTGHQVVVFVGNMEYPPNQEAVNLIAQKIAPKVQRSVEDVKFIVVGRNKGIIYPNLIFTGVVDDLAEVLVASDVAIAPLLNGSGTRLKILEYFSCSLPVVSTQIGVEGLDVINGVHVLVEDNMDEFASKIVDLLNDRNLSKQLGNAAREMVINKYDWANMVTCLTETYRHCLLKKTVETHIR